MEQVVDSFDKTSVEEVRATLSEFKGHQLFSLRIWTEIEGGKRVPTRKGLTLKTDLFPVFKKAVEKLEAALIGAGLLDQADLSNDDRR